MGTEHVVGVFKDGEQFSYRLEYGDVPESTVEVRKGSNGSVALDVSEG